VEYCKEGVQNTHHRSGRTETCHVKGLIIIFVKRYVHFADK